MNTNETQEQDFYDGVYEALLSGTDPNEVLAYVLDNSSLFNEEAAEEVDSVNEDASDDVKKKAKEAYEYGKRKAKEAYHDAKEYVDPAPGKGEKAVKKVTDKVRGAADAVDRRVGRERLRRKAEHRGKIKTAAKVGAGAGLIAAGAYKLGKRAGKK